MVALVRQPRTLKFRRGGHTSQQYLTVDGAAMSLTAQLESRLLVVKGCARGRSTLGKMEYPLLLRIPDMCVLATLLHLLSAAPSVVAPQMCQRPCRATSAMRLVESPLSQLERADSPKVTREPCLQPLRLLPIQLPMPMSLLQLHAAFFSILIATQDSIECIAGGDFFLGTLGFLGAPLCERFAGTSSGSVIVSPVPSVKSLSVPVSSLSLPRFGGPHIIISLVHAFKFCKVDKNVIRGSINSTRWDFETTLIWIQMDGAAPGNQMIISHQWRNVTGSDARRKTHLFSINRPKNTKFHE